MIYNCDSHVGKPPQNNEDYCMGEVVQIESDFIGIFALLKSFKKQRYD